MAGAALLHRRGALDLEHPVIMGVVNVTPDSFSDGGRHFERDRAVSHALALLRDGADILDIGGESTRPGAEPVDEGAELDRVIPVIEELRKRTESVISVDTTKATVACEALMAGADIVNDISGLVFDERMAEVIASTSAGCVLMHTPAPPAEMMGRAEYVDVVGEVSKYLRDARDRALAAGVRAGAVALDPGFGFGKLPHDNWLLLRELDRIVSIGCPVLVGVSRKRMLREALAGGGLEVGEDFLDRATATVCSLAWVSGARLFRVHDVRAVRVALTCAEAWTGSAGDMAWGRKPAPG